MHRLSLLVLFTLFLNLGFSQKSDEKIGISKYVKPGLVVGGFWNPRGEYVYILQQNSRVKETTENNGGGALSLVFIIAIDKRWANILVNIPVFDIKGNLNDIKISNGLFNTQTPFGLGYAIFPIKNLTEIGFGVMANFSNQYRLREESLRDKFFPIADYPTFGLEVTAPVPEAVLKPFLKREPNITFSAGLIPIYILKYR